MSLSLSAGYTINIVTHPPARPSVRSSVLFALLASPARAALAFQPSCMHRPYTRPIMYSVRDFVFDKYKSTRSGAQRNPSRCRTNAFREIRKTCGIAAILRWDGAIIHESLVLMFANFHQFYVYFIFIWTRTLSPFYPTYSPKDTITSSDEMCEKSTQRLKCIHSYTRMRV